MNKVEIKYNDVVAINDTEYRVFSVSENEISLHNEKGEVMNIEIKVTK